MSAPTIDQAAEPTVAYVCPCCIEFGCSCRGQQVTGTTCTCCAQLEEVTTGSERGKMLPCSCGAVAYPQRLP